MKWSIYLFLLAAVFFSLSSCDDVYEYPEDINIVYDCGHVDYAFHEEKLNYYFCEECRICAGGDSWQEGYKEAVGDILFLLELEHEDAIITIREQLPDFYGDNSPIKADLFE